MKKRKVWILGKAAIPVGLYLVVLPILIAAFKSPQVSSQTQSRPSTVAVPLPSSGNGVPVTIGNASPNMMRINFRSTTRNYSVDIEPCPTCKVYSSNNLPPCPKEAVYKSFILPPEIYQVTVGKAGAKANYISSLDLTNTPNYTNCFYFSHASEQLPMQEASR